MKIVRQRQTEFACDFNRNPVSDFAFNRYNKVYKLDSEKGLDKALKKSTGKDQTLRVRDRDGNIISLNSTQKEKDPYYNQKVEHIRSQVKSGDSLVASKHRSYANQVLHDNRMRKLKRVGQIASTVGGTALMTAGMGYAGIALGQAAGGLVNNLVGARSTDAMVPDAIAGETLETYKGDKNEDSFNSLI